MDSGSGSIQSSSGGDEEYDSHQQPQLFPPPPRFFNNNNIPPPPPPPLSHIISSTGSSSSSSIPHPQQLPFHLSHHNFQNPHSNFYDYPSNYNLQLPPTFNPDSANSFLNLDVVRPAPTSLRSEPTDFKNPPSSEGSTQNQIPVRSAAPSSAPAGLHHPKVTTKKRTRASRRAPTTVLTTDTSNFRAMVQEFTGIPSPPFSAGGSSFSRRFDLFGSVRTTTATNILEASGSALYPSPSKVQLTSPPLLLNNNNNNNVVVEAQTQTQTQTVSSNLQQAEAGIFSLQSLSGSGHDFNSKQQLTHGTHLEPAHIHGSNQILSALQNEEGWRGNGGAAPRPNNAANCKLNFSDSSSNLHRDKEILGNFVSLSTTRGESTVDSWICPSD